MSYIATTDIKHAKLASKVVADDITDLDNWFETFVLTKNVEVADIPVTLHDEVKTMLINKCSMDIAQRFIGINPIQRARGQAGLEDPYLFLYEFFKKEFFIYRDKMNEEMILNDINEETDTVGDDVELFRS